MTMLISNSDLDITLRNLINQGLKDDEILKKLKYKGRIMKAYVLIALAYIRDYPNCPSCNSKLVHKSIEEDCPECLYCYSCKLAFEVDPPYKPLEII